MAFTGTYGLLAPMYEEIIVCGDGATQRGSDEDDFLSLAAENIHIHLPAQLSVIHASVRADGQGLPLVC